MSDWIEWKGGECPVDENAIVKYRLRCGSTDTATANDILWNHFDAPYDVIAYSLHNQDAATSEQPKPKGKGNPVLGMVLADLTNRALEGNLKYGEPLLANNGRDALVDAYQEALDLCMYLRQAITERDNK